MASIYVPGELNESQAYFVCVLLAIIKLQQKNDLSFAYESHMIY